MLHFVLSHTVKVCDKTKIKSIDRLVFLVLFEISKHNYW